MTRPLLSGVWLVLPLFLGSTQAVRADWPQWGGSSSRNNVSDVRNLPVDWHPGEFERKTGQWLSAKARNIKWVAPLGSQSYGSPVIADGRILVGSNNGAAYLKRYPAEHDLGCLLCFREQDGQLLWQFSAEKLPTGRVNDWPLMGIVSSPLIEGDRAWLVSNRGEVVCLDTHGFYDGEDDGPVVGEEMSLVTHGWYYDPKPHEVQTLVEGLDRGELPADLRERLFKAGDELPPQIKVHVDEKGAHWSFTAEVNRQQVGYTVRRNPQLRVLRRQMVADQREADVVWRFDMMEKLGSRQHNLATCCITSWKDTLFVCTGNGVDDSHRLVPAPQAPSFFAMDKRSGEVLWTSNLPGANIHHGQWSAPAVGLLGGVPQVVFCGGDGWVYSFHAEEWRDQRPKLLWKFDTNAKDAVLELGGRGTRNEPIAIPVLHDNKVFVTTGQDPEHGEGAGCIWCIDPAKRGDISPELAVNRSAPEKPIAVKRVQAVVEEDGDKAIPNPNSGVVWKYDGHDSDGDEKRGFYEQMHRSISSVVIADDLLFCPDFSGLFHCLDARTGKPHWNCDLLAACWTTPLVADGRLIVCDEDGDTSIFRLSANPALAGARLVEDPKAKNGFHKWFEPAEEINMLNSIYCTPVAANGMLYLMTRDHLFAIESPKP